MLKDFKSFAVKGNMMDIAIGVVIGAAFNKMVDAIVKEIIMPPLSMMTSGVHWEHKKIVLKGAVMEGGVKKAEAIAIGYGKLIETSIDFLIISITVFVMVRVINSFKKKAEDPKDRTVETPKNIELLDEIAELLKKQNELLAK